MLTLVFYLTFQHYLKHYYYFSVSGGPITAAHSGQIPAVNPVPVPTEIEFDNDPFPLVPIHKLPTPTSAKHASSQYENKGVGTDKAQYTNVPINESIISLLFKLHAKLSGKEEQYIPLSRSNRSIGDAPIGDGPYFIGRVLDKLSQQSTTCARNIEELYSVTSPKKDNLKQSERDEERYVKTSQGMDIANLIKCDIIYFGQHQIKTRKNCFG